ncbi:MAG: acyltransferase [Balneola sp.]|nr:acyltransferase [Balneola sp.]
MNVARGGNCQIGDKFRMNNGLKGNPIGRPQRCVLFVDYGAILIIGENVGMSSTAIVSHEKITIGNNVKIGGGVCIYDTDFHSLDPNLRKNAKLDQKQKNNKPVTIKDNVFIGAHSTILKGVTIGENAIIGACSLVTRDIPSNEIWGGNPAKLIKNLDE